MFSQIKDSEKIIDAINHKLNAELVFNVRIKKRQLDNGTKQILDPFIGYDDLRQDKELILKYIQIYPPIYNYISPKLRDDKDILISLARAPLYYVEDEQNKNSILAKSPLLLVIDEHKRRCVDIKRNRDGSIETIIGDGLPFVENTTEGVCKIKDFDLIKKALMAELKSYTYSIEMYNGYGQLFQYKGIHILKALKYGETVVPSKYMNLVSLQLASKEILEDENCIKQIEEIIQQWVQMEKAKDEQNEEEKKILSSDLDWFK